MKRIALALLVLAGMAWSQPNSFNYPVAGVYPVPQYTFHGVPGPYRHSGNLYWIFADDDMGFSSREDAIVARKSTDGGLTSTRISSGLHRNNLRSSVYYPGSGTVLYIGFADFDDVNTNFKATTFDMATDTWGAVLDTGIAQPTANYGLELFKLPNGNLVMVFDGVISLDKVWATIYNGTSWSSLIAINGSTPASILATAPFMVSLVDGNGNVGTFWMDSTSKVYYSILVGSTVTTTILAFDGAASPAFIPQNTLWPRSAFYDTTSGSIVWVILRGASASQFNIDKEIDLVVGAPFDNPTFTVVRVANDHLNSLNWLYPGVGCNQIDVTFMTQYNTSLSIPTASAAAYPTQVTTTGYTVVANPFVTDGTTTGILQMFTSSSLTSGWTGPTTYYDASLNPVTPTVDRNSFAPLTVLPNQGCSSPSPARKILHRASPN